MPQEPEADLLVIGGGMAGLTAAAVAAKAGASVVVAERADVLGGSGQFAGFAWTAPSVEVMRQENPRGVPELGEKLVDDFADAVQWIKDVGADTRDAIDMMRFGRGHEFDTNQYIGLCADAIKTGGGRILLNSPATELIVTDGQVVGAKVQTAGGPDSEILASYTLIATGGFQGDPQLRAAHIHPQAADLQLRSNPYSDGAGLRLGTAVGAAFGFEDAGFYGHLIPYGVKLSEPSMFVEMALYYSEHCLLFDLDGQRFIDETVGDHLTTMALVKQREARGLLVADAVTYRDNICGVYVEGQPAFDKFDRCLRRGGRGAVVDSLEDFDLMPPEWGYPGEAIRKGIEEFNAAMKVGADTVPPRLYDRRPLDTPPYYVMDAVPAITFTLGGLLIDPETHVLDGDGRPIPGLLCAGSDAGGLYRGAYAGGLAPAIVFGRQAAQTVLAGR